MKNIVVYMFLIFFLVSGMAFSQIYFKLGGGYSLDFNSMEFGLNRTSSGTGTTNYEAVTGSLGKGLNLNGAIGFNFLSFFGFEAGGMYKLSTEFEVKNQTGTSVSTETTNGSFLAFTPAFVINAPFKQFNPFVKMGLLIAIPSVDYEDITTTGVTIKGTFKDGIDFGLTGGAGVLIPLDKRIRVVAEIFFVSFTWKPGEIDVEQGTQSYTVKIKDEYSSSDPFTTGPIYFPFSNVGVNIGIQVGI